MAEGKREKGTVTNEFVARWHKMSKPRKIALGIMALAMVVFLLLLFQHFSKPRYVVLYSNLDAAQASPLVQELKNMGVSYHIDDFGSTIKVPQEAADELRIEMAGKGLPFAQGLGFELFDEGKLGMTDFERQMKLQRALQEELRRTITSLDAVLQARVHLVLPEPRIFLQERAAPSAAVYLQLNPFVSLKQEQVKGIVYLVASSVENLKAEDVIVIDSEGNILYDATTTAEPYMTVAESVINQLEIKRNFETELERRLQTMLGKVFGPGKVLALVTAEMDFDAHETTVIEYNEEGTPRSTHLVEERFEGEGSAMEEVGEANYPGYVGAVPGGESSYERTEETVNYEIGEKSEKNIIAPGKVLRLHTSVVVDTGQNAVTPEQIEQVTTLISAAIGYDQERGDQVSVEGMNFDTSSRDAIQASMAELEQKERREQLIQRAVLGAAALLALILLLIFMKRRRRKLLEKELLLGREEAALGELLTKVEEEDEDISLLIPEDTPQKRVKNLVEQHPDVAISILRSWLVEK